MKYNCLVIDDEAQARKLITTYISKIPELELVSACKNALEGQAVMSDTEIDILFLDINMPELNGIDFIKLSKKTPATIFITAYSEYALSGYELDVVDYLLKPVEFPRFYKAVLKAFERIKKHNPIVTKKEEEKQKEEKKCIFVKANKEIIKLNISSIQYIEGMREYVRICTVKRKILTLLSLSRFIEILPENLFFKVHKSFIVNIQTIDNIIGNTIFINGNEIPISRGNKKEFIERINKDELF